jgi:hypothetical protein
VVTVKNVHCHRGAYINLTSGTGMINGSGVELFSRLEQQRTLTLKLLERIVDNRDFD